MRIRHTLLFVVTSATMMGACYFRAGTGPSPAEMQNPAPPLPPPPAPAPAAQAASAKPPPPLTPAEQDALRKGTWRKVIVLKKPGVPVLSPSAPPAPAPAPPSGCLDVSAAAAVPACAPRFSVCAVLPAARCGTYARTMVPTVAAAAVACVNGLTADQLCDPSQTSNCGHAALARACPDTATVGPLCELASGHCKSSPSDCVSLLSGLTPESQDAVARCIGNGCSTGLYACVEGLGSSP